MQVGNTRASEDGKFSSAPHVQLRLFLVSMHNHEPNVIDCREWHSI